MESREATIDGRRDSCLRRNLTTIAHCAATFLTIVACATPAGAITIVDTCGQLVERGRAVLADDLDCSAVPGPAVVLQRATLDLAGHTLTGTSLSGQSALTRMAVRCSPTCRIKGPGTISGGEYGIDAQRAKLRSLTVTGAQLFAVTAHGKGLIMRDVTATGNGLALGYPAVWAVGDKHLIRDSLIEGNGAGIYGGGKLSIRNTIVRDNFAPLGGVFHSTFGVRSSGQVRIKDSTITGHAPIPEFGGPACDETGCVDIRAIADRIKTKNVVCETSVDSGSGSGVVPPDFTSLGLCSNDGDIDQDASGDLIDLCDYNPACSTADSDGDLSGDCCDNCPGLANHDQFDNDQDGLGDDCDPTPCPPWNPNCLN